MKQKSLIIVGSVLAVVLVVLAVILVIPTKYTVTFDTNGGTVMEEIEVKKGTLIGDLEVPTKAGYTFLYWTVNGKVCSNTDKITDDMKLTAKWERNLLENPDVKTFTVTFDSNGGSTVKSIEVEEGKKVNALTKPTKEGYTFIEWTFNGKKFDFNTSITKDITLVAKWEKAKEEVKTFTVTFNTDGGSKVTSKTVIEGNKVSKPSNPTKTGYTFVSWTLDGKNYDFNTKITKNITLKATWKKVEDKPVVAPTKYTVTFNTDGGGSISSQTIEENGKVTKPSDPKKDGYTFKGWYVGSTAYNFDTKVTSNFTLTAKWEEIEVVKTYTVTFNTDGGSSIASQTIEENGKVTKPSNPKKDGYKFLGWYLNGSTYNFDTKVTGNITLTAKWEKLEEVKTYTISISKVDDYSTDRYVTVKENGVAIRISKLMHTNGVEIPSAINGNRLSVAFIEIEDVTSFKVLLTNGKTVTANVE